MATQNRAKAERLYGYIDASGFYANPVARDCRSWMNVPFTVPRPELEKKFCDGSAGRGSHAPRGTPFGRRHARESL